MSPALNFVVVTFNCGLIHYDEQKEGTIDSNLAVFCFLRNGDRRGRSFAKCQFLTTSFCVEAQAACWDLII
jgi:hypothetical protein